MFFENNKICFTRYISKFEFVIHDSGNFDFNVISFSLLGNDLKSFASFLSHSKKREGLLSKKENQPRGIEATGRETMIKIPLLGAIAAGQPIEAIQDKELIAVPKSTIPSSAEVYALRVVGSSMIDEDINDEPS